MEALKERLKNVAIQDYEKELLRFMRVSLPEELMKDLPELIKKLTEIDSKT
jgi:hypothetical protein